VNELILLAKLGASVIGIVWWQNGPDLVIRASQKEGEKGPGDRIQALVG
jgi:hypothetical protein